MTPHLVKWHEEYGPKGLTIIDIDNGLADSLGRVKAHVAQKNLPFPVLHDADGAASRIYGVRGYPTGYLIGQDGRVIWEGHPAGNPATVVAEIQKALGP